MLGFNKKTQDASPQENTGGENKVLHFIRTHKKRCIAAVVAVAVLAVVVIPRRSRSASADMAYVQEALGRRDIVNVYDGSGTINAADSYTVKSLVTGTVLHPIAGSLIWQWKCPVRAPLTSGASRCRKKPIRSCGDTV